MHQVRNDVPIEVSNIVARLMAKKPEQRFQTPLELANALTPYALQGTGSFPTLNLGSKKNEEMATGESPWADIFDADEQNALISTLPSDMSATPMQLSLRLKGSPAPSTARKLNVKWIAIGVLAAAAIAGFFLGALTLLLLI